MCCENCLGKCVLLKLPGENVAQGKYVLLKLSWEICPVKIAWGKCVVEIACEKWVLSYCLVKMCAVKIAWGKCVLLKLPRGNVCC